jgi:hypothetical protein
LAGTNPALVKRIGDPAFNLFSLKRITTTVQKAGRVPFLRS